MGDACNPVSSADFMLGNQTTQLTTFPKTLLEYPLYSFLFFLTAVSVDSDRGTAIKCFTKTNAIVTEGEKNTMVKNVTFQLMIKSLKSVAKNSTFNWMDPEFVKCSGPVCQTIL